MIAVRCRNITDATIAGLRDLRAHGSVLTVRGQPIREVTNRITHLSSPAERCLFLPNRGNDPVAAVAETMWVLAGRNDVAWLRRYLPRASEFSDDGLVWRAGYGPRLRNWNGVDQLDRVRRILLDEPASRRAVVSIFDPAVDFLPSKDVPCTNWLGWLIRGGRLDLSVALRSNDVIWGFSGVNAFEWSVLHEAMAFWTAHPIGSVTYLAGSFHLYARHFDRADAIQAAYRGITCYDFGVRSPAFQTPWDDWDAATKAWFSREAEFSADPDAPAKRFHSLGDPMLQQMSELPRLRQGVRFGWCEARLRDELAALPESDFTAAAYEYFARGRPELLTTISHSRLAAFFAAWTGGTSTDGFTSDGTFKGRVKALHRQKDAAYAKAWKRRGETMSILPNIFRKADRLEVHAISGANTADENALDTAVDLLVYALKYQLFLLERMPDEGQHELSPSAPAPLSDHTLNFDALLDRQAFPTIARRPLLQLAGEILNECELLNRLAAGQPHDVRLRLDGAGRLADLAAEAVTIMVGQGYSLPDPTLGA